MNVITGRHGELDGHLTGYPAESHAAAIAQTAALARRYPHLGYMILPDEAAVFVSLDLETLTYDVDHQADACLTPWRFDRLHATAYCLYPAGHDNPAATPGHELVRGIGIDYGLDAPFAALWSAATPGHELTTAPQPEHGWYRLIDAIERGEEAMDAAAARISAHADAVLARTFAAR